MRLLVAVAETPIGGRNHAIAEFRVNRDRRYWSNYLTASNARYR